MYSFLLYLIECEDVVHCTLYIVHCSMYILYVHIYNCTLHMHFMNTYSMYTVPQEIDFPRYDMTCSEENVKCENAEYFIQYHVFLFYRGNLDDDAVFLAISTLCVGCSRQHSLIMIMLCFWLSQYYVLAVQYSMFMIAQLDDDDAVFWAFSTLCVGCS